MTCFKLTYDFLDDLRRLICSFWWGGNSSSKKIHWVSWDVLSRSKSKGGLGFRNLHAFNLAMLSKQAWHLHTNPSSLLAQVLKAKYHPSSSLFDAGLGSCPSWSWRSIVEGKRVLIHGCRRRINSGENTKIWADPWLPIPPHFRITSPQRVLPPDAVVSSLIDVNSRSWNQNLLSSLFSPTEIVAILSIPICSSPSPDGWTWHPARNEKYSVKSTFHFILENPNLGFTSHHGSTSSAPVPVWKLLWNLKLPGKILHFLWRSCTNSLPSYDNLIRRRVEVQSICPFCDGVDASLTHLFFLCIHSRRIWYIAGLDNFVLQFQQPLFDLWMKDIIMSGDRNIVELFATICHSLWWNRNQKLFADKDINWLIIVQSAASYLADFRRANGWPERHSLPHSAASACLVPPDGLRVFFDAGISFRRSLASVGVACLDARGRFAWGFAKIVPGITSPETAEFLAFREAIVIAKQRSLVNFSLVGDAASVVFATRGEADCSADCLPILEDTKILLSSYPCKGVFWHPRAHNLVAHTIASYAKCNISSEAFWLFPLDFLCQSGLADFQHI